MYIFHGLNFCEYVLSILNCRFGCFLCQGRGRNPVKLLYCSFLFLPWHFLFDKECQIKNLNHACLQRSECLKKESRYHGKDSVHEVIVMSNTIQARLARFQHD